MNARHDFEGAPQSILDVFLQPGDLFWGSDNVRFRTLLGSCVAIVIWHPVERCGGMSHFLLPRGGSGPKYGTGAMAVFRREILASGRPPGEYLARVFGGGNMFEGGQPETARRETARGHVGDANVKAAYDLLDEAGIPVVAADTGGRGYRKLIFECWSGRVWLKRQDQSVVPGVTW